MATKDVKVPGTKPVDLKDVRMLAELLHEFPEIGSIEVRGVFDTGVVITRTGSAAPQAAPVHAPAPLPAAPVAVPAATAPAAAPAASTLKDVKSPMVGTFYKSPEPGAEPYVKVGSRIAVGPTVYINLSDSKEHIWQQVSTNHQRDIKRLMRRGYYCTRDDWNRFPEFIALYHANMQRVGAKGRYFFSRAYFEKLRTQLGDRVHLVCAMTGTNDLAAAGLMIITDGIAQHHLLATAEQYQRRSPSKLVVDCMWRWAQEQVCHTFHIGGGVGGREDSLFHFKAGFSPMRSQFCSYRVVMDNVKNRALNLLVNLSADVRASADFFPGYRHFEKQSDSALIPPMIS